MRSSMDFDRGFKRAGRTIGIIVVVKILILAAIIFTAVVFGGRAIRYVGQHGLKNSVMRIWEGPE